MIEAAVSRESGRLARLFRIAITAGVAPAVRLHLARGDDPDARDDSGLTPLMLAAQHDRHVVAELLIAAGADATALDPAGRSALDLAQARGAREVETLIRAHLQCGVLDVQASCLARAEGGSPGPLSGQVHALASSSATSPEGGGGCESAKGEVTACRGLNEPAFIDLHQQALENALSSCDVDQGAHHTRITDAMLADDWEPVSPSQPPALEPGRSAAEAEKQRQITVHVPEPAVGQDWEDVGASLPDAACSERMEGLLHRELVRSVVTRAFQEGSVPRIAVENAMSVDGAGEQRNPDAEAALAFLINDLGAELDEREEFRSQNPWDNFEVTVAPLEEDDDDPAAEEALQHLEKLLSLDNDPLRMYQREALNHPLLDANAEIELARAMDNAAVSCARALAQWPAGLDRVIDLLSAACDGKAALSSLVLGATSAQGEQDERGDDPEEDLTATAQAQPDEAAAERRGPDESPAMILRELLEARNVDGRGAEGHRIGGLVERLKLRRSFLVRLESLAAHDEHPGARDYVAAVAALLVPRARMVRSNQRLVYDTARRYLFSGMALEDLIQEGNLGLLDAVDRFDWRRGYRFSTMAIWWIRQGVSRSVSDKSLLIRMPAHVHERLWRLRRAEAAHERMHGRLPPMHERAAMAGMTVQKLRPILGILETPLEIADPAIDGMLGLSPDDPAAEEAARSELRAIVEGLLGTLKPKEASVIRQRFGIGVRDQRTLEEVGASLGLTRERARQIESKALRKLAASAKPRLLGTGSHWAEPAPQLPDDVAQEPGQQAFSPGVSGQVGREALALPASDAAASGGLPTAQVPLPGPSGTGLPGEDDRSADRPVAALVAAAWALGIPVSRVGEGRLQRHTFGITRVQDNRTEHLVAQLVGLGFRLVPGVGYQQ